jgi:NhaA family Na+:H+ antiporter
VLAAARAMRAPLPGTLAQVLGVAAVAGIGFTMSLFIGLLAFPDNAALQDGVKIGILLGSLVAAALGALVLMLSPKPGGAEARAF